MARKYQATIYWPGRTLVRAQLPRDNATTRTRVTGTLSRKARWWIRLRDAGNGAQVKGKSERFQWNISCCTRGTNRHQGTNRNPKFDRVNWFGNLKRDEYIVFWECFVQSRWIWAFNWRSMWLESWTVVGAGRLTIRRFNYYKCGTLFLEMVTGSSC